MGPALQEAAGSRRLLSTHQQACMCRIICTSARRQACMCCIRCTSAQRQACMCYIIRCTKGLE